MGKIMIGSKPSQCFFHSQTRMATDILSWLKLMDQMVSFMAGLTSGNWTRQLKIQKTIV